MCNRLRAIVLHPEFGELKRMYVSPAGRGRGLARQLLSLLETSAVSRGCKLLRLETGPYQQEALALYARRASSVAVRLATTRMIP